MPAYYEYELGETADITARDLFELKPGETLVVTADTESDERVVDAVARAAFACGAKPLAVCVASALGVSQTASEILPFESLTALLEMADDRLEFKMARLYSNAYHEAREENRRLCYPL